jgi:hypothetical protein
VIVHLIEDRDMANVVTMCKQLAVLAHLRQIHRQSMTHWQQEAVEYLPTQIMEALGIAWAEGPEHNWEHLITEERLEHQLSYGIYRRRAFKEALVE